jgi:hypothetical protein
VPSLRGRAVALAALAATIVVLPAAAAAQEPAPAGTSATVEVLAGGDDTLELWRDAATGEIALIDTRQPEEEQVMLVRGTGLRAFDDLDGPQMFDWRYRGRAELSEALRGLLGIDLAGVEAALAAGAPAPRPARVSAALAFEAGVPDEGVLVSEHFGSAARALARRSTTPVAWAGPRRLGLRVRQSSLVELTVADAVKSPVAYVMYGRGPIPFPAYCDGCFGVASAPIGSAAAREFTGRRPFTERVAGRPALDSPVVGSIAVRLGPLIVLVDERLGPKSLRRLVRSLRIIRT